VDEAGAGADIGTWLQEEGDVPDLSFGLRDSTARRRGLAPSAEALARVMAASLSRLAARGDDVVTALNQYGT